ncbi:hypothetical protein EIK77_000809 [Talaromyces pinophilus]|nr:hypothetical protein EIK77_000809 [Talaromyces pinophilus]
MKSMYYHTALIILYRPPRQLNSNHFASYHGGMEICEQSLNSICQLFKAYGRDHGDFQHLPMTFIHIIATATSLILLKLRIPSLSTSTIETTQQLDQISNVVNNVAKIWPAAVPIQAAIEDARQRIVRNDTQSIDLQDTTGLDWQVSAADFFEIEGIY